MKKFIFPDFNKSNLNISSTLAWYLNVRSDKPKLEILQKELSKGYKNVVFICFDGLGINPINLNLSSKSFLKKHIKDVLLSTFPSTTTCATTSLMTNKYPLEHGWFGWSLYFSDIKKNINIFQSTDSLNNRRVHLNNYPMKNFYKYFDLANSNYRINTVFPPYVEIDNCRNNYVYETMDEFFLDIKKIINKENNQFVYAYCGEPDTTMHIEGVKSNKAKKLITKIDKMCEELYQNTKDTLFIITADHGQIDVEGYVDFYHDEELMSYLEIYPYLEPRAVAFKLKNGINKDFENYFNSKYKEDFKLYKTEDLINMNVFGPVGDMGHLLGDYIAIGTYTHKIALLNPMSKKFKGHHTSLTEEMEVPLIMFNN